MEKLLTAHLDYRWSRKGNRVWGCVAMPVSKWIKHCLSETFSYLNKDGYRDLKLL